MVLGEEPSEILTKIVIVVNLEATQSTQHLHIKRCRCLPQVCEISVLGKKHLPQLVVRDGDECNDFKNRQTNKKQLNLTF